MAKDTLPVAGLFKNGNLWWIRTVFAPLAGLKKRLSTGTADTARANAIKDMVDTLAQRPKLYEWLDLAVKGELSLARLYDHYSNGSLQELKTQLDAAASEAAVADLSVAAQTWIDDHLSTFDISERSRKTYENQLRYFIPKDVKFPASLLTEDYIKAKLTKLTGGRLNHAEKVSSATRRRYLVPLKLFIKYAKKRSLIDNDPLVDIDWMPKNGSPRATYYEFPKVKQVLDRLSGQDKAAMALVFGSGIELGALLALQGRHVGATLPDGRGTITAPGSKNEYREDRTIFVDAWAWKIFHPFAKTKLHLAPVFTYNPGTQGRDLREPFYLAQVAAGLVTMPERDPVTHKLRWGTVNPHTIHDARHSYCINRSLGLDGEEPRDATFLSMQLGHADETMVLKIYKKANITERLRLLQLQATQKAAQAAQEA